MATTLLPLVTLLAVGRFETLTARDRTRGGWLVITDCIPPSGVRTITDQDLVESLNTCTSARKYEFGFGRS